MVPVIETLNELAAAWSACMLRASWQGGLAIVAAWVLLQCRPALAPQVGCWVWRLVDLKLMVALFWAGPLLLPLLPPDALAVTPIVTVTTASDPSPNGASRSEGNALPDRAAAATVALHSPSAGSTVFLVWLSGAFGAAILVLRDRFAVIRLRRSCAPIDRPDLRAIVAELAGVFGLRSVPELRAGPEAIQPMLVGTFHPAILLPVALVRDARSAAEIRAIVAHELAHVRRRDLVWSGLTAPVQALFFFHPLVWLAHRESILARETACDALALRATGLEPAEYGRILLHIAAGGADRPLWRVSTLGMAGSTGFLKRRLIAMKTTKQPSRCRLLAWALAVLALGTAGIVPWRLVPREAFAQACPPIAAAKDTANAAQDRPPGPTPSADFLKLAESRFEIAWADQRVAQAQQNVAEGVLAKCEADLQLRQAEVKRLAPLVASAAVEAQVLNESLDRLKSSQAAREAAQTELAFARASLTAARAAVREAGALGRIARAESHKILDAKAEGELENARAELRRARLDRARAEHEAAGLPLGQAQAKSAQAEARLAYRQKQVERMEKLVDKGSIDPQVLHEERLATQSSQAARDAAAAQVGLTRARLDAAAVRLRLAEAEAARPRKDP